MNAIDANTRILVAMAVVIAATRVVGWGMAKLGQPRVLGEILAGVLLGPSLLGLLWSGAGDYLFPEPVVGGLTTIAQIGLVLFMFLVGLDVDMVHLRGQGRRAVGISHMSIVAPFALGIVMALWIYPRLGAEADHLGFVLFIGAAMSITAFPVLARILQESGLESTRIGALALTCAAVDDVTAWCLLAGVIAIVNSSGIGDVALTVLLAGLFIVVMVGGVRRVLAKRKPLSVPAAVAFALVCAWLTEMIGIHAIFGAFMAGMVMPSCSSKKNLADHLETMTTAVLLPVFFAVVGLSTRIGLLSSPYLWAITALITVTAVVGKLGGSAFAARITGETWNDALTIGVLMNTRGLTELVILSVGLELGVVTPTIFTALVFMALATTFMAGPLLGILGVTQRIKTSVPR